MSSPVPVRVFQPLADEICAVNGEKWAFIRARSIPELFTETRKAPNLVGDIPDHSLKFVSLIEQTACE